MSEENEQKPQAPEAPPKKLVWIKCRARRGEPGQGCEGNQAEVVFDRSANTTSPDGSFMPTGGGHMIRYRCQLCRGTFHINT